MATIAWAALTRTERAQVARVLAFGAQGERERASLDVPLQADEEPELTSET